MILNSPVKVWRKQKEITSLLGKRGKIVSYSLVHVPPLEFERQTPYPVVLVSFDQKGEKVASAEGFGEPKGELMRVGQLVDWRKEDLQVGKKVEAVCRRIYETDPEGVIPYGIKFRPVG